MGTFDQTNLTAVLKTSLGKDVLVIKSFTGSEGLGEPFSFGIEALSEEQNIDFDKALGQPCSIKLKTYENKERFFCGILVNAQWTGEEVSGEKSFSRYSLVLRPWFWLLNHSADCRIFHYKNVKQIIEKVFTDLGFSSGNDFKFRTSAHYEPIKYCVQYRESDYAFVSRLMEQYGIYYYFEHRDAQHTMVLADSRASHSVIQDLPKINFNPQVSGYHRVEQHLASWVSDRRFCTGEFELNDYDYLQPPKQLRASKETSEHYVRSHWKVYDYPGKYDEQDEGNNFAQIRLEAEQALDRRRNAQGDAPSLFAGGLVTLQSHSVKKEDQEYLVVRVNHRFGTQSFSAGGGQGGSYSGGYQFMTSDRPFRMLPLTPKPRIHGTQTAKVVGKNKSEETEEISTDEHGRIWVQFYWDRGNPLAREEEDREPKKSCPLRVAQPWAGKRWGHQFIPRIGMEVVVEFLEGDPDRPLVVGCVYNGDNTTPSILPQDKNWSGVKSDSTKGHHGHNYIIFNDTKGEENFYLVAEKDHEVKVRDSETRTIGHNRNTTIKQGDDELVLEKGGRLVACSKGGHTTMTAQGIFLQSNELVNHCVIDNGVTSIVMTGRQLEMQSSEVEITAPIVRIMGNVQIVGNLMVVGQVVSLSAVVGGRPV
jgi:type VI secretion system secreted protein VgrG